MTRFSVCLLCYGDYPTLAQQALSSIVEGADWQLIADLRIGGNAISTSTRTVLEELARLCRVPTFLIEETSGRNVHKYPLMRRMFYPETTVLPPLASHVMWFDDDSHITAADRPAWWRRVARAAQEATLIGARHRGWLRGQQHQGIAAQPWATQMRRRNQKVQFVTGGWWIAPSQWLAQWDYPFLEIQHNSGDVMLGELCIHQGKVLKDWREGVAINAGHTTKLNAAGRRGDTTKRVWEVAQSASSTSLRHQHFAVCVRNLSDPMASPPPLRRLPGV